MHALTAITDRKFFEATVRRTFEDLALPDQGTADYLTDLVVRFAQPDGLATLRSGAHCGCLRERLQVIDRVWALDTPDFQPEREIELRRELADYALFMSGFFWEHLQGLEMTVEFAREGTGAYRFVAEYSRVSGRPDAPLLATLATGFELYAVALSYLRDVRFGDDRLLWPRRVFARVLPT